MGTSNKDQYMVPVLKFPDLSLTFLFPPFKCVFTHSTPVESYKSIMQWVGQTLSSFCGVETEVERDEPWLYFTAFGGRVNEVTNGRGCLCKALQYTDVLIPRVTRLFSDRAGIRFLEQHSDSSAMGRLFLLRPVKRS